MAMSLLLLLQGEGGNGGDYNPFVNVDSDIY